MMGKYTDSMLDEISRMLDAGLDAAGAVRIIGLLGGGTLPVPLIEEARLYSEFLPKAEELPYTPEKRYMHLIWDMFDKLPAAVISGFAIPFRRLLAERLFKRCGKNLICEEGLRFNYANNIELGDDVFFNRGCFIDSKGGVKIGNGAGLTECVFIYSHNHNEADHTIRNYRPVVIEDYSIIYSFSIILPGVTVGRESIVSARSVVHDDVEAGTVVSGAPAKVVRPMHNEGRHGKDLNHIWLNRGIFQDG